MPIQGPSSFAPVTNLFLAHWEPVNTALGVNGPLVLPTQPPAAPGTITRGNLETHRNNLVLKHTEIQGKVNDVELAAGVLRAMKTEGALRLNQFKEKVNVKLAGTAFPGALPLVPSETDGQGNFVEPMDDMETLWTKVNALVANPSFTPPLTLLGGYALGDFSPALGLLRTQFSLVGKAEVLLELARGERTKLEQTIYPILKAYRLAVPSEFAENDPLVLSLPKLTPDPGSTPDAVSATGIWNAPTTQGKITWTASTAADLYQYEIRWSPGSSYSAEDEVVIGNIAPAGPLEFFTLQGLGLPGAQSVFKVYVVTTTGNEKGSNTVKITRP